MPAPFVRQFALDFMPSPKTESWCVLSSFLRGRWSRHTLKSSTEISVLDVETKNGVPVSKVSSDMCTPRASRPKAFSRISRMLECGVCRACAGGAC